MSEDLPPAKIQARMQLIRREADEVVDDIVVQARRLTQWQYYVRRYPWIAATAAAAVGYLIVPQRIPRVVQPDPETLAVLSREGRLAIRQRPTAFQALTSMALNQLSSVVLRSAASYLADTLSTPSVPSPSRKPTER